MSPNLVQTMLYSSSHHLRHYVPNPKYNSNLADSVKEFFLIDSKTHPTVSNNDGMDCQGRCSDGLRRPATCGWWQWTTSCLWFGSTDWRVPFHYLCLYGQVFRKLKALARIFLPADDSNRPRHVCGLVRVWSSISLFGPMAGCQGNRKLRPGLFAGYWRMIAMNHIMTVVWFEY